MLAGVRLRVALDSATTTRSSRIDIPVPCGGRTIVLLTFLYTILLQCTLTGATNPPRKLAHTSTKFSPPSVYHSFRVLEPISNTAGYSYILEEDEFANFPVPATIPQSQPVWNDILSSKVNNPANHGATIYFRARAEDASIPSSYTTTHAFTVLRPCPDDVHAVKTPNGIINMNLNNGGAGETCTYRMNLDTPFGHPVQLRLDWNLQNFGSAGDLFEVHKGDNKIGETEQLIKKQQTGDADDTGFTIIDSPNFVVRLYRQLSTTASIDFSWTLYHGEMPPILRVSANDGSSITMNWEGGRSGGMVGWRLERASASDFTAGVTVLNSALVTSYTFSSTAVPASTLYYRVYPYNNAGDFLGPDTTTLQLHKNSPDAPGNFQAWRDQAARIKMTWTLPGMNGATLTNMKWRCAQDRRWTVGAAQATVSSGVEGFYSLSGDTTNSYYCWVTSDTDNGQGGTSTQVLVEPWPALTSGSLSHTVTLSPDSDINLSNVITATSSHMIHSWNVAVLTGSSLLQGVPTVAPVAASPGQYTLSFRAIAMGTCSIEIKARFDEAAGPQTTLESNGLTFTITINGPVPTLAVSNPSLNPVNMPSAHNAVQTLFAFITVTIPSGVTVITNTAPAVACTTNGIFNQVPSAVFDNAAGTTLSISYAGNNQQPASTTQCSLSITSSNGPSNTVQVTFVNPAPAPTFDLIAEIPAVKMNAGAQRVNVGTITSGKDMITTGALQLSNAGIFQAIDIAKDDATLYLEFTPSSTQHGSSQVVIVVTYVGGVISTSAITVTVSAEFNYDDGRPHLATSLLPSASLGVSEAGTTATFTVVLTMAPVADVTVALISTNTAEATVTPSSLLFTPSSWSTAQLVTITGVDDTVEDGRQDFQIQASVSGSGDGRFISLNTVVNVYNTDNEKGQYTVTTEPSPPVTSENGATAVVIITLKTAPLATLSIACSVSDGNEAQIISGNPLIFTTADWQQPHSITIKGVDDTLSDGSKPYTLNFAPVSTSDVNWAGITFSPITLSNVDNEVAGVVLQPPDSVTVSESGTTAEIKLTIGYPKASVTVSVVSGNSSEVTVSPATATLTTSNYNQGVTITVTGQADSIPDGHQQVPITITLTSTDALYNNVTKVITATNLDINTQGVVFSPPNPVHERGTSSEFVFTLGSYDGNAVIVSINSSDSTEGTVSPALLTLSGDAWSTPQTVTVTGVDDPDVDGDVPFTIVLSQRSSTVNDSTQVPVTCVDDDVADILITDPDTTALSESGTTALFTVRLAARPQRNATITVPLESSNPLEGELIIPMTNGSAINVSTSASLVTRESVGLGKTSVVFNYSTWDRPVAVYVRGVKDDVVDGTQPFTITIGPSVAPLDRGFEQKTKTLSFTNAHVLFASLVSIRPQVSSMLGTKLTAVIRHWTKGCQILVSDLPAINVTVLSTATQRARVLQAQRMQMMERMALSSTYFAPSGQDSILPGLDNYHIQQVQAGDTTVEFVTPELNSTGSVDISIIMPSTVATTVVPAVLRYTDDCPIEGQFGVGKDCKDCPEGGVCPGGNVIIPQAGYWNSDASSGFVFRCTYPDRCPGGGSNQCAPSFGGEFCTECAKDYYTEGQACLPCGQDAQAQAELISLLLAALIFFGAYTVAVVVTTDRNLTNVITVLMTLQLVRAVGSNVSGDLPEVVKRFYAVLGLLSMEASFLRPECVGVSGFTGKMIGVALFVAFACTPLLVLPVVGLVQSRIVQARKKSKAKAEKVVAFYHRRFIRACIIVPCITFLNVTTSAMQGIYCVRVEGKFYLRHEMSTQCFVKDHIPVGLLCLILTIASIAFPIYLWFMLKKKQDRLYIYHVRAKYGYIYEGYKNAFYRFACLSFSITLLIIFCNVFLITEPLAAFICVAFFLCVYVGILVYFKPFRVLWKTMATACAGVISLIGAGLNYTTSPAVEPSSSRDSAVVVLGYAAFALSALLLLFFVYLPIRSIMRGQLGGCVTKVTAARQRMNERLAARRAARRKARLLEGKSADGSSSDEDDSDVESVDDYWDEADEELPEGIQAPVTDLIINDEVMAIASTGSNSSVGDDLGSSRSSARLSDAPLSPTALALVQEDEAEDMMEEMISQMAEQLVLDAVTEEVYHDMLGDNINDVASLAITATKSDKRKKVRILEKQMSQILDNLPDPDEEEVDLQLGTMRPFESLMILRFAQDPHDLYIALKILGNTVALDNSQIADFVSNDGFPQIFKFLRRPTTDNTMIVQILRILVNVVYNAQYRRIAVRMRILRTLKDLLDREKITDRITALTLNLVGNIARTPSLVTPIIKRNWHRIAADYLSHPNDIVHISSVTLLNCIVVNVDRTETPDAIAEVLAIALDDLISIAQSEVPMLQRESKKLLRRIDWSDPALKVTRPAVLTDAFLKDIPKSQWGGVKSRAMVSQVLTGPPRNAQAASAGYAGVGVSGVLAQLSSGMSSGQSLVDLIAAAQNAGRANDDDTDDDDDSDHAHVDTRSASYQPPVPADPRTATVDVASESYESEDDSVGEGGGGGGEAPISSSFPGPSGTTTASGQPQDKELARSTPASKTRQNATLDETLNDLFPAQHKSLARDLNPEGLDGVSARELILRDVLSSQGDSDALSALAQDSNDLVAYVDELERSASDLPPLASHRSQPDWSPHSSRPATVISNGHLSAANVHTAPDGLELSSIRSESSLAPGSVNADSGSTDDLQTLEREVAASVVASPSRSR